MQGTKYEISTLRLASVLALVAVFLYFWETPPSWCIRQSAVFVHEINHASAAVLTGGRVINVLITRDEGGACETEGGIEIAINAAGYLGVAILGMILVLSSRSRFAPFVDLTLMCLVFSAFLATTVNDPFTWWFGVAFVLFCFFGATILSVRLAQMCMFGYGVLLCIYTTLDIYHDILDSSRVKSVLNDGVVMARMLDTDPHLVGMCWLVFSLAILFVSLRSTLLVPVQQIQNESSTAHV